MVKDFFNHQKNCNATNDQKLPSFTSPLKTEEEMQQMMKVRARFVQSDSAMRKEMPKKE